MPISRINFIRIVRSISFGVLISLISVKAIASAETDFELGTKYFSEGNYKLAVIQFENAYKQGMRSLALYYNLGSSYFKLRDYKKAEIYFSEVAKIPDMKPLAEYNLGLIALKKGDIKEAQAKFNGVIQSGQDQKLISMAKQQLKSLPASDKLWTSYISGAYGYDDNITAVPNDVLQNASDTFIELYASVEAVIQGDSKQGWLADAKYYSINYDVENAYDETLLGVGIKKAQKLYKWDTQFVMSLDDITYGGDDFQRVIRFEFNGKHVLSRADRIYLSYRYEDITSENVVYDYLEGWRQRIRAEYRQYGRRGIAQFYYEFELNDRQDTATASYSPLRHTVRGKYSYRLNDFWEIGGDLSYRISDYEALDTQNRKDDRWQTGAYIDYRFDKTFKVRTGLTHTINESTEDEYDYDKRVISIGLSKLF